MTNETGAPSAVDDSSRIPQEIADNNPEQLEEAMLEAVFSSILIKKINEAAEEFRKE